MISSRELNIHSVILSGGSGSRLWPSSRASLPKQFIEFLPNITLFGKTLDRIQFNKENKLTIVSNKEHNFLCRREVQKHNLNVSYILEEMGRNTASAILAAALNANQDDILVIMPADHWIEDSIIFNEIIKKAAVAANLKKCWVTLGVVPTEPNTGYGYINAVGRKDIKSVKSFTEKPDIAVAKEYLANTNYFWNSGIFVVSSLKCVDSFKKLQPELFAMVKHCYENRDENGDEIILREEYLERIPSISIDYAILENEHNISMVPFKGNWSDVGSWDSLSRLLETNEQVSNLAPYSVQLETKNTFIHSTSRTIAAVGVKDLIIVDDDDATLVVQKGKSERVKEALQKIKFMELSSAVEHTFEYRPWGMFENLLDSKICKVKRLTVNPGQHLSLQYHKKRSEHWVVVQGKATVKLENRTLFLISGNSIDIPLGAKHALGNDTDKDLIVVEVQMGSYFGEDDIVRVSDPYNR